MATLDVAAFSSPVVKAFLAGSLSGTCSTLIFQPLDLMKTRIQQQAESRLSMRGVCKNIVAQENILGLWRGVVPSLVRTVPGVGLYFSSMHFMKANLCEGRPSHLQSVLIGSSSRAFAGAVMIPFTVIKTRFESNSYTYTNTYQAFKNIFKLEGFRGLTSGLGPTLFRDVPFSGLYLMFYEHLKSLYQKTTNSTTQVQHTSFVDLPQVSWPVSSPSPQMSLRPTCSWTGWTGG